MSSCFNDSADFCKHSFKAHALLISVPADVLCHFYYKFTPLLLLLLCAATLCFSRCTSPVREGWMTFQRRRPFTARAIASSSTDKRRPYPEASHLSCIDSAYSSHPGKSPIATQADRPSGHSEYVNCCGLWRMQMMTVADNAFRRSVRLRVHVRRSPMHNHYTLHCQNHTNRTGSTFPKRFWRSSCE